MDKTITASIPATQEIKVFHPAEVAVARLVAKHLAEAVGFDSRGFEEIALAVSELASNLVKHANGGRLILTPLSTSPRMGLQIETVDNGPGILNIHAALMDGFSTSGSLGNGLGAVNRLMDEFQIAPHSGQGTHIICRKWVRNYPPGNEPCPFDIGVATRAKTGCDQNGDDYVIKHWPGGTLVGVIDGLGHGEPAHLASVAARNFVESHYDLPLAALFHNAGYACQGTRGCVMALARFYWKLEKISFASVGNIEARVIGDTLPVNLNVRRGIVGSNAPDAHVSEHPWHRENMLVLFSDGVHSRWNWNDFPQLLGKPASQVARGLLHALANPADDATILIVKPPA